MGDKSIVIMFQQEKVKQKPKKKERGERRCQELTRQERNDLGLVGFDLRQKAPDAADGSGLE